MLDWWQARLSLLKFLDKEEDKYLSNLARYAHRYKIDYHDLSLDGELQIDNYENFRHFAHLAQTNPYFRLAWPTHLFQVTYENPEWRSYYRTSHYHRNIPQMLTVSGEIREWNSRTRDGQPAIKLLTGGNRVVSETTLTRIPKDKITRIWESSGPSSLLAFLKDMESNIRPDRFFEPAHHDTLMHFPDGKDWVIIRDDDISAEGSSLGDCGRAENGKTILISLREPVTSTHYQALLKAEIAFPSLNTLPLVEEIKKNQGIIVQLRGFRNSKPSEDLHPYILPLLQQSWIVHLVEPNFSSRTTFDLEDLNEITREELKKKKPILFSTKRFYNRFKNRMTFAAGVRQKILDRITMPPSEIIKILGAKRYNLTSRRKALEEFKKRLNNGVKHMRSQLFAAAEELLMRTKAKPLISDIMGIFSGHKRKLFIFLKFYHHRKDWLFENLKFFMDLFVSSLPNEKSNSYYTSKILPPSYFRILMSSLSSYDEKRFEFVFKLIYETRFHEKSGKYLRLLVERMLELVITHDSPDNVASYERVLSSDLCDWYQNEPGGWGSTSHRIFSNEIPLSNKLKKQFLQLIKLSIARHNDCYLDLAMTIYSRMSADNKRKLSFLGRPLFEIIMGGGRLSKEAYEALGRIIN
jgi:hypothetical protein